MCQKPLSIKFVTPAMSGFFIVSPLLDEHNQIVGTSKEPIVAWAIDESNCVFPVTPDLIDENADATLCPDGTVQDLTGTWENLDDWLTEKKARVLA